METKILKGKPVSKSIREDLQQELEKFSDRGIEPKIAVIYFGEDPSTLSYIKSIEKTFAKVGVLIEKFNFPEQVSPEKVLDLINKLNHDETIHGIIVEMPIPSGLSGSLIYEAIDPQKDIDCMTPVNYGRLLLNRELTVPATAGAVIEVLKAYGFELKGRDVTIIGRSNIVGKPLILLMLKEHATVTVCHTRTRDLKGKASGADILVVSAGKAKLVNSEYVCSDSIVIDVGINFEDGQLCGDVDYDDVVNKVQAITPVPGGIGPVTTAYILKNLVSLMKEKFDE